MTTRVINVPNSPIDIVAAANPALDPDMWYLMDISTNASIRFILSERSPGLRSAYHEFFRRDHPVYIKPPKTDKLYVWSREPTGSVVLLTEAG